MLPADFAAGERHLKVNISGAVAHYADPTLSASDTIEAVDPRGRHTSVVSASEGSATSTLQQANYQVESSSSAAPSSTPSSSDATATQKSSSTPKTADNWLLALALGAAAALAGAEATRRATKDTSDEGEET